MYNDDSFNDSDEIFNVYSSKMVTETYKAQLHKLVSKNPSLTNGLGVKNTENMLDKLEEKGAVEQHEKELQPSSKEKEISEDSLCDTVRVEDCALENSLEDSIEVIGEKVARKVTRQSARLRKKRDKISNDLNNSGDVGSFEIANTECCTRSRKRATRGNKRQKSNPSSVPVEIVLDDSPRPIENLEEDELNPEVSVKVIWKSVTLKKFQIRKFQKMSNIFKQLSEDENIPEDKIMLTFNNVRVNRNDTPDSLNLQVYHFIDGGVLSELTNLCELSNSHVSNHDDKFITLKFQDMNKKIMKLTLNRNDKIKVGMIKYSEQLEIPLEKIKFFFDGEILEPSETLDSVGLENDEIIDVKLCG